MFDQFFEGTTQAIYEAGQDTPITSDKLEGSKTYDVREFAKNTMLRCQTVSGSDLMEYLGIKPAKKAAQVDVVKEKKTSERKKSKSAKKTT